jgi:two-component system, NtrC family, nitrogen regulation response regulator NtrX
VRVDVRVVAATNKDLPAAIKVGQFREDLYFRLNVIPIFVPPLRARQADIPPLADHFMAGFAREYGRRPKRLSPAAVAELQRYAWPGNVRELRNVIERLMIMVAGDEIGGSDVAFLNRDVVSEQAAAEADWDVLPLHTARDRFEQQYILRVLAAQQGNMSRTAEALGVERSNLYRKMRAFGIAPARRADTETPADEEAS